MNTPKSRSGLFCDLEHLLAQHCVARMCLSPSVRAIYLGGIRLDHFSLGTLVLWLQCVLMAAGLVLSQAPERMLTAECLEVCDRGVTRVWILNAGGL